SYETDFRESQSSSVLGHPQGRHPTSRAAGLVDAVGGDGFVIAGAGAEVCFGSGSLHRAEIGTAVRAAASAGFGEPTATDSGSSARVGRRS
ncbi:MAG: hypothetical protein QOE48_2855, partial [Mycobacterium sp.]|nr:hypothetical protein [Mycobacterium sp.]